MKVNKAKYKIPTQKISCRVIVDKLERARTRHGGVNTSALIDLLLEQDERTHKQKVSDTFRHTSEQKLRSPLCWFGGKHYLAKSLIPCFPDHFCYVEPFGGGAHILVQKPESRVEVYNDIDENAVNFFLQIRSDKDRFVEAVSSLPYSRALYEQWRMSSPPDDPFERAVRWFYLVRGHFSGNQQRGRWKCAPSVNCAQSYQSACRLLESFVDRLQHVMYENSDFRIILDKFDRKDTFFMIDPPYRGCESAYPAGDFSDEDHIELAKRLQQIQGKFLVTYYEDELIHELYHDCFHTTLMVTKHAVRVQRGESKPKGVEQVYTNYEIPSTQMRLIA
jgi:DNA adenine methylase